jgi:hypothetical protein
MTTSHNFRTLLAAIALLTFSATTARAQDSSYAPTHESPEGQEIVFVYLGSYDCGPCHKQEFKRAIEKAKVLLNRKAKEARKDFSAIGADMGWDVERGIAFLKKTGRFDEIMVGRSWTGSAASQYIWQDDASSPAKPSVVVYERNVESEDGRISISEPEYLVSKSGVGAVMKWVKAGVPLNAEASEK